MALAMRITGDWRDAEDTVQEALLYAWKKAGSRPALESARERARQILAEHQPREIDTAIELEMDAFKREVAGRSLEDFYLGEQEESQEFGEPQGYSV